jgi:hypothetical protein
MSRSDRKSTHVNGSVYLYRGVTCPLTESPGRAFLEAAESSVVNGSVISRRLNALTYLVDRSSDGLRQHRDLDTASNAIGEDQSALR